MILSLSCFCTDSQMREFWEPDWEGASSQKQNLQRKWPKWVPRLFWPSYRSKNTTGDKQGILYLSFIYWKESCFQWNVPTIVPSSLPGDNLQAAAQEWTILLGSGDKKTRTELRSENTKKGSHCRQCSEDCQGVTVNLGWNSGVCTSLSTHSSMREN